MILGVGLVKGVLKAGHYDLVGSALFQLQDSAVMVQVLDLAEDAWLERRHWWTLQTHCLVFEVVVDYWVMSRFVLAE